jgi:hypothetical protein
MIRTLPPAGVPAIVPKLIARLSSPFDHEVISVARSIGRILESNNLDWNDLAAVLAAPPRHLGLGESGEARQMRAWLEAIDRDDGWLNAWTAGFVGDLLRRPSLDGLTGKQMACVNRIIRQAYNRGVQPGREAA